MKMGLVWFGNDLRCTDQQMLWRAAQEVDQLICLYCDEPEHTRPSRYATQGMSDNRRQFLYQGLDSLAQQLDSLGHPLFVSQLDAINSLTLLLNELPISHIYMNHRAGWNEQESLRHLTSQFSDVRFHIDHGQSLFEAWRLPFNITELPDTFSKFRRQITSLNITEPLPSILQLPLPVHSSLTQIQAWQIRPVTTESLFTGGEKAAQQQLKYYFNSNLPRHYKQVRNALAGWENSTKFSAWLAQGSLSPKQVIAALTKYEAEQGANESTDWIYFELLWREYFHWYATCHGRALFTVNGLTATAHHLSFYPERFRKWCRGNTPYPLVNACMKQLNQTGYMSNRGRQIAASCLIYELGIDWRYGAAYFEEQLIDYDVGSNWGNWQYIAGVGADPRGGRHFDLEKQTQLYDPNHAFIDQWQGADFDPQLDSVDAADWPVYPHS